jgi:CRP-like cAMP-binding protein
MTADLSQTPSLLRAGRDRPDGAVHPACGLTRSGLAQVVDAGVETVSRVLAQFVLDAVASRRGALIGRVAPTAAAGRGPR